MKGLVAITLLSSIAYGNDFDSVRELALNNGFNAQDRVIRAIVSASHTFGLNPLELGAIAILESGMGKYDSKQLNANGTRDIGMFQINTVNLKYCNEFNLNSMEGNSHCAAKLLKRIKTTHKNDYLGIYHSKTKTNKEKYIKKLNLVLNKGDEK